MEGGRRSGRWCATAVSAVIRVPHRQARPRWPWHTSHRPTGRWYSGRSNHVAEGLGHFLDRVDGGAARARGELGGRGRVLRAEGSAAAGGAVLQVSQQRGGEGEGRIAAGFARRVVEGRGYGGGDCCGRGREEFDR